MEKLQYESDKYIIYGPDSLSKLIEATSEELDKKIDEYKKLFGLKEVRKIQVNYFDSIEKFRNFVLGLREKDSFLPEYAAGTYDKGMINSYIDKEKQMKNIYMANHELFHILYKENVLLNDNSKRIVWYDEGMAQFFSNERKNVDQNFESYFNKVKEDTKIIPNINEIDHGKSFKNENYNGYDLSYFCVRYLNEILDENEFKSLMNDFNKIKEYGNTIIQDMFNYYDNKLENNKKLI